MALSYQAELSDGTLQRVLLSIDFFDTKDIRVTQGNVILVDTVDYHWDGRVAINLTNPVPAGVLLTLRRHTDITRTRLTFNQGAPFVRQNIDSQNKQFLFLAQETSEGAFSDVYDNLDMHRYRIINLADPTEDTDATNKRWVKETFASALANTTQSREAVRRTYAEVGLTLVKGSFEEGGVLNAPTDILIHDKNAKCYAWKGALPKVVPAKSTPESTGGISDTTWVDVSGRLLATQLGQSTGASTIGCKQSGSGAVLRTVQQKLGDTVCISDYGAVAGTDCAAAIIAAAASTTGTVLVPAGNFTATATTANSTVLMQVLKRICIDGSLTLNVSAGTHVFESPIEVVSASVRGLRIVGAEPVRLSILRQVSVSGSAGNHSVVLEVSNTAGVQAGQYLHTTDTDGTGVSDMHRGMWLIDSVNSNRITVINTCRLGSFPVNTISGSVSYALSTVLYFKSCDGIVVNGSRIDFLNNVAIVGDSDTYWNASNVAGTEKGTHGIYVGAMTIALNGKVDNVNQFGISLGHVSCGPCVGVNGFDQQGVCVELSGTFWGDFVSSCNNKRRGFYSSTASGIRAKHISANGNYLDGVITDIGGQVYASSRSCACGNGGRGVVASSQGSVIFDSGITSANIADGVAALSNGFVQCTVSKGLYNSKSGVYAEYGGVVYCNNSDYSNNGINGIHLGVFSTARALNCTLNNNYAFGIRCDDMSTIVHTGSTFSRNGTADRSTRNGAVLINGNTVHGGTQYCDAVRLRGLTTTKGIQLISGSGGDIVYIGYDAAGNNSYKTMYNFASNTNGFYPSPDNTQLLGRAANRWDTVYAGTGTIHTSDGREKTTPLSIEDAILDAWGDVSVVVYRWLSAIQRKGDDCARWHFGVVAQQVRDAFLAHNLDGTKYGLLCYDSWEDKPEVLSEDGVVLESAVPAGDRWGVRIDQCLFLEAAYQRRCVKRIEQRVSALEATIK